MLPKIENEVAKSVCISIIGLFCTYPSYDIDIDIVNVGT